MINVFNEVYTDLVNHLTTYDPNIKLSSVYTNMPTEYPFVSLEEIENVVYQQGSDCMIERFASVEYEANIYTQSPNKKSKADGIANEVDALMVSLGFTRVSRIILQDSNETTYRIVMRFDGVVSQDHIIYRR